MPYTPDKETPNLFLPILIEKDEMYVSTLTKKFQQYQQYLDDELPTWNWLNQRESESNWNIDLIIQSTKKISTNCLTILIHYS